MTPWAWGHSVRVTPNSEIQTARANGHAIFGQRLTLPGTKEGCGAECAHCPLTVVFIAWCFAMSDWLRK